jgi:hypothetical protein
VENLELKSRERPSLNGKAHIRRSALTVDTLLTPVEDPEGSSDSVLVASKRHFASVVELHLKRANVDQDLAREVAIEVARGYGDLASHPYLAFLAGVAHGAHFGISRGR